VTAPRVYPPYASPGWLVAYTTGALSWLAIAELWGGVAVLALLGGGVLCCVSAAHALGEPSWPEDP